MDAFENELASRLEKLADQNLRRTLRRVTSPQGPHATIEGRAVLNFSSNDYLGLANHPELKKAAATAIEDFGTGSGASRLICGSLEAHEQLEAKVAHFKGTESSLVFSTGYATALGTITALVSSADIVVLDKLVHASIVDAARLSGAKLRIFAHNDLHDLEEILIWCETQRSTNPDSRVLVVTESLFSMDGDFAPLQEIVALKEKHGAWLMVDEAHATGLFGNRRSGFIEELGLTERVEIQMGTLGKALGSAGGFIAGKRVLRDYLINKARSFVFSTAPPPATAAASSAAIDLVQSEEGKKLVRVLQRNIEQLCGAVGIAGKQRSPIVPIVIGEEKAAMEFSALLLEIGIFVPAIRYPTVARGKARLRVTLSAAHQEADIEKLVTALGEVRKIVGVRVGVQD